MSQSQFSSRIVNSVLRNFTVVTLIAFISLNACAPIAPSVCKCKGRDYIAKCDDCHGWFCDSWWADRSHCGSTNEEENKTAAQGDADAHNRDNPGHHARPILEPNSCGNQ